jgi:hypothetical protein
MQNNTTLITATTTNATTKLFSHAGISKHPSESIGYDMRAGNSANRFAKELARYGHTEIRGVLLSEPKTKLDAAIELLGNEHFQDELAQTVLKAYIAKNGGVVPEATTTEVDATDTKKHGKRTKELALA